MMKQVCKLFFFLLISNFAYSQNLEELDNYTVDEFFKKVDLEYGTLNDEGDEIEYIYVKTKVELGDYKIILSDSDGDLYKVKDQNLYIRFKGYFGYAGYSTECIMKVDYYSTTVYKLD